MASIMILVDNNLDTVGGEQESTKIVLEGLKRKFDFIVVQPGRAQPLSACSTIGITRRNRVKKVVKNPFVFLYYFVKLALIINRETPAIIHTQSQVGFFIISVLKKCRIINHHIITIHTERGLYTKYGPIVRAAFESCFRNLSSLILTTQLNRSYWLPSATKSNRDVELTVIENTAGAPYEESLSAPKARERKFVVGFAGRYCTWKNWALAVEIVRGLNESWQDMLCVEMAVGCLDRASEIKTNLMFRELDELMGARFNGQINVDLAKMLSFYKSIDFFVLTSNPGTESFGRTVVEAMSVGDVVLSTYCGGPVEVLEHADYLASTAGEFVAKIEFFLTNSEVMRSVQAKNMKRARDRYSLENNIRKHDALYSELLGMQRNC